ncbi:MAG: hypothetical protein H7211_17170, partial [Aquabacterium sp.]|nr:hypothetical protein [Ferruginibacter sp.]
MQAPTILKLLALSVVSIVCCFYGSAQSINPKFFNSLQWRMIGPHRGGRTVG